jgi:TonB-linked SusC/RagA family outer membrane protein
MKQISKTRQIWSSEKSDKFASSPAVAERAWRGKHFIIRQLCLVFFFLMTFGAIQAQKTVRGTVVDEDNSPLIGVSVFVQGTSVGTSTDINGAFSLAVPASASELHFRFIGMNDQIVKIGTGDMRVIMTAASENLDEVVVVAYGEARRKSLTGAVSAVTASQIEARPLTNVMSALEGVAGLQMTTGGQPGSDPSIRIRGYTTINGSNSPLFVIDGVPFGGNYSDLNPQDVESISVLKDAAASSLYGNRASNGVVLITTKRGKTETPRIEVFTNQGVFERGIAEYDRLEANDWMETMFIGYRNQLMSQDAAKYPTTVEANEAARNSVMSSAILYNIYNKGDNELFDANGKLVAGAAIVPGFADDLDWWGAISRKGYRQEYGISAQGGNDKTDYFFSASYLNEQGYVLHNDFDRFTGRSRMTVTPNKWFKAGFNLSGSRQMKNYVGTGTTGYINPVFYARNMAPVFPIHQHYDVDGDGHSRGDYVYDESGNMIYFAQNPQMGYRHWLYETEMDKDESTRTTMDGSLFGEITFLNDFKFRVNGNLNSRTDENDVYQNAIIGDGAGNNGRAGFTDYRYKEYTFQQQLTYAKTLGNHNFDILAAHENYSYNRVYSYGRKANETFANQIDLINFTEITSLTGYSDNYRLESYLSRARYNYSDKYFLDASYRRDGSSRFYYENRWGDFWSAGGSWIISSEDFMAGLKDKIDYLKFRTSYGSVGNDASVGYYAYMALYALSQNGGKSALYKSQLEALNLLWESATSFGVALESRLFNRLDLSVEYYDKRSRDLLFDVNLPLSAGATTSSAYAVTLTKNLGSIANRGVEINANVEVIKQRDFKWNVGTQFSTLKNTILTLPEENRENGIIDGTKKYMEGRGRYDFWLYQFAGTDQMTGRALYLIDDEKYSISPLGEDDSRTLLTATDGITINGQDYVYKTTYAKRDWSGSAIPNIYGSFNTSLDYKGINLSALFTFAHGGKMIDYNYQSLLTNSGKAASLHVDVLEGWVAAPEGMTETSPNRVDPNQRPAFDFIRNSDHTATSTQNQLSSNYLLFKSLNLSYSLPKRWIAPLDLYSLRVNISAENLYLQTAKKGSNPLQSFTGAADQNQLQIPRVISFGLKVQF